jgi:hypothetical protein
LSASAKHFFHRGEPACLPAGAETAKKKRKKKQQKKKKKKHLMGIAWIKGLHG